jgi:calcium/calmodulin-dependent protein kinase I
MDSRIEFSMILKSLQDCFELRGDSMASYFEMTYASINLRKSETFLMSVSPSVFSEYLNLPVFIGKRILKFFDKSSSTKLSLDVFVRGMYGLYLGSLESLCKASFKVFDLADMDQICHKDVIMVLYQMKKEREVNVNIEETVLKFFETKKRLDFVEYVTIIATKNSDVLILFLFFLFKNQPFSKESINTLIQNNPLKSQEHKWKEIVRAFSETKDYIVKPSFNLNSKYTESERVLTSERSETSETSSDDSIINVTDLVDLNEMWQKINISEKETGKNVKSNLDKLNNLNSSKFSSSDEIKRNDTNATGLTRSTYYSYNYSSISLAESSNNLAKSKVLPTVKEQKIQNFTIYQIDKNSKKKENLVTIVDNTLFLYQKNFNDGCSINSSEVQNMTLCEIIPLSGLFIGVETSTINDIQLYSVIFTIKYHAKNHNTPHTFYFKNVLNRNVFFTRIAEILKIKNLKYEYIFFNEIGSGKYGKVKLAVNVKTQEKVAIKKIKKYKISKEEEEFVKFELDILTLLMKYPHENVCQIFDIQEDVDNIYIIMELVQGGNLEDYIKSKMMKFSEIQNISFSIAKGINFLHSQGIVHRDLKPTNILYDTKENEIKLKITDFGFSRVVGELEILYQPCGSLIYAAPEIFLKKHYNKHVDIWSYGVIVYNLCFKTLPFLTSSSSSKEEVVKAICYSSVVFPEERTEPLQPLLNSFKELIQGCLKKSIVERFTIDQIMSCKLFTG